MWPSLFCCPKDTLRDLPAPCPPSTPSLLKCIWSPWRLRSLLLRHPEQLKHHCLLLCVPPTSLTGGKLHSGGGCVGETDSNRECLSFQHFLFCACITASTLQSQEFDSIVLFSKVSTHPEFWISKSEWHEIQLKKELLRKKHITKYVIVLVFHFTAVFVMVKKIN